MELFALSRYSASSRSCSVGSVRFWDRALGPRAIFGVPRVFGAFPTWVGGKRLKLGVLGRVGEVARLGRCSCWGSVVDYIPKAKVFSMDMVGGIDEIKASIPL